MIFKRFIAVLSIGLTLLSCEQTPKKEVDLTLLHATPYNAHFIIQINDKQAFIKNLSKKNAQLLFDKALAQKIPKAILANNRISTANKLVLASAKAGDDLDILLISKTQATTPILDTVALHITPVTNYNQIEIKKMSQFEEAYFFANYKSLLLGSYSRLLIENAIRQLDEKTNILSDSTFVKAYKTIDTGNFANILVNNAKSDLVQLNPFDFDNITYSNNAFCDWTALDVVKSEQQLLLNGISLSADKTKYLETLANSASKKHELTKYAPATVNKYKSIALADFKQFKRELDLINVTAHNKLIDSIFPILNEAAVFTLNKGNVLTLASSNTEKLQAFLLTASHIEQSEIYRGETIFQLVDNSYFNSFLSPFIQLDKVAYFYQKDQVFYFSNELKVLKLLVATTQNDNYLLKNKQVKELFQALDDEGALLLFSKNKSEKEVNITINQYNYSDALAYVNILIKDNIKVGSKLQQKTISFDTKKTDRIQFFTNFRKKTKQLLLFDKNEVSLVDKKGKTLWKKEIDGQLLGDIVAIDIYKNNKKQVLFATKKAVYCLDVNGNDVSGFPIKTKGITQGIALFDYDNNKTYRIAVSKGKSLELYNGQGKKLAGFKYKGKSKITSVPKHFRSFNKDYIVFTSKNGALQIVNRRGQARTTVQGEFNFSANPLYFSERFIVFTDKEGTKFQVNVASGKVLQKPLKLSKKHFIFSDKKQFITFDKNILKINSKIITLPLGNYAKPIVLKRTKKTVVLLFNKEENKLYCYNSQGNLQSGFPVYASDFIQATVDKNKFIVLTKEEDDNLILYSFF
jgi:hypothetical protein